MRSCEQSAGADRETLLIGVDEAVAEKPSGRLAEDLERRAQSLRKGEARPRSSSAGSAMSSFATRACSIGSHSRCSPIFCASSELAPSAMTTQRARSSPSGVAGGDADDRAVVPQEVDNGEFRVDLSAGLLGLRGVPAVERRAQDGVGVVGRRRQTLRAVGGAHHRVVGQKQIALLDDRPLQRRLGLETGHERFRRFAVEDAAPDVLRARELAALQHDDREPGRGQLSGRGDARRPRANDDRIKSVVFQSRFLVSR